MSTILMYESLFGDRMRDSGAKLMPSQTNCAIAKRNSRVRPIEVVQDYVGDGTTFDFTLPTGWIPEFSTVRSLEYPAGQRSASLLNADKWTFYRFSTSVVTIRLPRSSRHSRRRVGNRRWRHVRRCGSDEQRQSGLVHAPEPVEIRDSRRLRCAMLD